MHQGFLASPYTTLHVTRDESQTWKAIQHLIEETETEGLVVGLPISMDGEIHSQGKRVQAFAERLKEHIAVPITFWDERLSTVEAERLLIEQGELSWESVIRPLVEENTIKQSGGAGNKRLMLLLHLSFCRNTWILK